MSRGKPKGSTKTGGRKAGTPNRTTSTLREWVQTLLDGNRKQIEEDLKLLPAKERVQILLRLLDYCLPRLQSVSTKIDFNSLSEQQIDAVINQLADGMENEGDAD